MFETRNLIWTNKYNLDNKSSVDRNMNHFLLEYKYNGLYKIKITGGTYG
jgi:hypothetical protein